MRNSAFLVMASVVVGLGAVAYAGDENHKAQEFNAECRFIGANAVPVGKGKGAGVIPHECLVRTRFCKHHHSSDGISALSDGQEFCDDNEPDNDSDDMSGHRRARLEIECDGRFLFRDRARTESIGEFDFIAGFPNGNPVLKLPHRFDNNNDGNGDGFNRDGRAVNAWLRIGPTILAGVCAVEKRHHHPVPPPTVVPAPIGVPAPVVPPAPGPGPTGPSTGPGPIGQ